MNDELLGHNDQSKYCNQTQAKALHMELVFDCNILFRVAVRTLCNL